MTPDNSKAFESAELALLDLLSCELCAEAADLINVALVRVRMAKSVERQA